MKDLFGDDLHTAPAIHGEQYAGIIRRETALAILFDDGTRQAWLPKSLIAIEEAPGITATALDRAVIVTIPGRLAQEKEFAP